MRAHLFALLLLLAPHPLLGDTALDVVAEMELGPGNLTLTPAGELVVSLHPFFATDWRVISWDPEQGARPFPNADWNRSDANQRLVSVLGLQSDPNGIVWLLDNALRERSEPRLVAWDSVNDRLHRTIPLPSPITPDNAFVNDLAVDTRNNAIYIADPAGGSNAALIVVDLASGEARRLLEGSIGVVPEEIDLIIDGRPVTVRGADGELVRPRIGVNPIALDAENEWLYFGPMHGLTLYRIRTRDLLDRSVDDLASRVEPYAAKPICDGISIDRAGNIYISEIGANAVGVIERDRSYRRLLQDPKLSWPDAFSFGPDGALYTVANQLHRSAVLNGGVDAIRPPFLVVRVPALAPGVVGR